VTFVKEAAEEANDPVYGKVIEGGKPRHDIYAERDRKGVQRRVAVNAASSSAASSRCERPTCPMCSQQHSLFSCEAFKNTNVQNRLHFVKRNRLCYNCLRSGHRSNACNLNRVCSVPGCHQKHTKFLHLVTPRAVPNSQNEFPNLDSRYESMSSHPTSNGYVEINGTADAQCSLIGAGNMHRALPIVPVCVKNPDTEAEVKTYATNSKKSCCLCLGQRHNNPCAPLCTLSGDLISWVDELRYLGVIIMRSRVFNPLVPPAPQEGAPG